MSANNDDQLLFIDEDTPVIKLSGRPKIPVSG